MKLHSLPMAPQKVNRCARNLFLLCFLSYTCSYIGRKNLSACLPAMIAGDFLTKSVGGYITTAYMLCYGAGQLISGVVGSHIKPRYMIAVGLFGAAFCNVTMGLLPSPALMPLIWALNGLCHAMLWSPIIRIFTDLLPEERRSAAGTHITVSCSVGAVLAFLFPGLLLKFFSWRMVFFISGGILAACFLIWVLGHSILAGYIRMMEVACDRRKAEYLSTIEHSDPTRTPRQKISLPGVMLASGLWVAVLSLICNGALRDAVETWSPTLLAEQFRLNGDTAALISVIIPIVSVTGTYAANGLFERWIHNELYTACVMFCIATLSVGGVYLFRTTSLWLCALFMAVSVAAMWGANHMYLTVIPYHFAPMGLSAAVTGTLNSIIYFATALCSGLYGVLAEALGWHRLMLVWLLIGALGAMLALVGGRVWKKRSLCLATHP